jgi:hypothetical protein
MIMDVRIALYWKSPVVTVERRLEKYPALLLTTLVGRLVGRSIHVGSTLVIVPVMRGTVGDAHMLQKS